MYTYLIINIVTIIVPLALSFERRVSYRAQWRHLFPVAFIVGGVFVVWDHLFTAAGIWGFNPRYVTGIYFFSLPLEEALFFICIPFSCVFVYEVVKYFDTAVMLRKAARPVTITLMLVLLLVFMYNRDKAYTAVAFFAAVVLLVSQLLFIKGAYMGHFYLAFAITLVPFLIVNGVLTRGLRFIDGGPVVWYNNAENLAIRIGTIPVEDFVYWLALFLANVTLYEHVKKVRGVS